MRAAAALLILCLGSFPAHAQMGEFSLEGIRTRAAELATPEVGLPESIEVLIEERRSIDNELYGLRNLGRRQEELTKQLEYIAVVKADMQQSIGEISGADCAAVSDGKFIPGERINDLAYNLDRTLGASGPTLTFTGAWSGAPWRQESQTAQRYCQSWKTFIGNAQQQAKLIAYLDQLAEPLQAELKRQAEIAVAAAALTDLLAKRRDAINKRLSADVRKEALSDSLWLVIVVIGAFSISAILAVKLFSESIQVEWVASGQVIQFVTVMILLSVIMALGLAEILKENTLGTLLGGVAGYVLAQGVGRAAAREVSRERERVR